MYYGYDLDNRRVYRKIGGSSNEEWTFFGAKGEKLATYVYASRFDASTQTNVVDFHASASNILFGGQLISDGNKVCTGGNCTQGVFQDRLETNRASGARFYPYGDEIGGPTATSNDREKYATYNRDSFTGFDYAQSRYYASVSGRFNTADPLASSATASDPGSWNRYAYTRGDPVNRNDPSGLDDVWWDDDGGDDGGGGGGGWVGGGVGEGGYDDGGYAGLNPCIQIGNALFGGSVNCGGAPIIPVQFPVPANPQPMPDCGDSLGNNGILATSATGSNLASLLLGENSWSKIGTAQYQNGDTFGNPTGSIITTAAVGTEDSLMLDVVANLSSAHDLSLSAQASSPGVFLGYNTGQKDFTSYQTSSVGSSQCNDLTQASLAVDAFVAGGSVARTAYNQFRGIVQMNPRNPRSGIFIRRQNPGDLRVGGTDFFTIPNP